MAKPDFHAQADGDTSVTERQAWFAEVAREFKKSGAVWGRYAIVDRHWTNGPAQMLVADGWRKRPADEGKPCVDTTYALD